MTLDEIRIGMVVGHIVWHHSSGGAVEYRKQKIGVVQDFWEETDSEWVDDDDDGDPIYENYSWCNVVILDEDGDMRHVDIDELILWEENPIGKTELQNQNHKL